MTHNRPERKDKSVEQRLYEAFRRGEGCRLTSVDVDNLVGNDDALRTRITNTAAKEAGSTEIHGHDSMGVIPNLSWEKFGAAVRDGKA